MLSNDIEEMKEEFEQPITMMKKLSSSKTYTVISKNEIIDDFDHISNFDPEDEFLNNDWSFSVIGSILSKSKDIDSYSDISIVGGSRASKFSKANEIKTERDIYIEDLAMQKIIHYISLFSNDV